MEVPRLYVHIEKALYGMLRAPLLFYRKLRADFLEDMGFEVDSYPANCSEEKSKKESKKSCKNYLGVADFKRIVRGICTKSNSHK